MPKVHLTGDFVRRIQCEPVIAKTVYYCSEITGFNLEHRPNGSGTYSLRYRDPHSVLRQIKIGQLKDITFAQARKKAIQLRSEVVLGGDPMAKKQEKKSIPLYAELAAIHLEYAKAHQKAWSTTEMYLRRHVVPEWGKTRLTDIEPRVVSQWLIRKKAEGLAPATVEKLRVTLGRSFELGLRFDIPGCDKNPTRGIPRKPLNNGRERFLTANEAERLREACIVSNNPQLQHIIGLLLLTGARKRELLDAKWENIDLPRRSWFIPTTKTGKPRHVPLSQAAIDIIENLPRFMDCPWLVPNPDTLKPFVSIKNAWAYAIKTANLPGLRIHDLRHSAASFMVNSGVDLFAVGKVLGHSSVQSTQRYSHLANDTLLKAVEAGAAKHKAW